AGLALTRQVQAHAGVDTDGHVDRDLALGAHPALARARGARVRDDGAVPAARAARARGHDVAEQRPHRTLDLTRSAADVAARDRGPRRAARALARRAQHRRVDLELVLRTEHDLVEVDLDAQQRILPPLGARPGARRACLRGAEE